MDTLFAAVVQTCCVAASASTFFYLSWSSGIAVSSQLSEIASENTSLIAQTFTFQKGLFIALWQSLSDFFFMRNTSNSKFLHLPLDQRPAFLSWIETINSPSHLLLLSRLGALAQTAEDSPRDTLPIVPPPQATIQRSRVRAVSASFWKQRLQLEK